MSPATQLQDISNLICCGNESVFFIESSPVKSVSSSPNKVSSLKMQNCEMMPDVITEEMPTD